VKRCLTALAAVAEHVVGVSVTLARAGPCGTPLLVQGTCIGIGKRRRGGRVSE
jgi:hypothetical protein